MFTVIYSDFLVVFSFFLCAHVCQVLLPTFQVCLSTETLHNFLRVHNLLCDQFLPAVTARTVVSSYINTEWHLIAKNGIALIITIC